MQNAFLVRLSMSVWTARKMDKNATKEAKARAKATEKAAVKVYKSVIAADALDNITTICNAARVEHRKRTVPWTYDGPGAITAEGYPSYKAIMAGFEREFNKAVDNFYAVYADEREEAKGYLGEMFNPADYPDTASLRQKFAFSVAAEPMPQAQDFRVIGLPPDEIMEIKEQIADNNAVALDNANQTAWSRVIERVEKLKLGLENYKPALKDGDKVEGKFHDTLIDNIKDLAGLIPSINITADPDLTRMQRQLLSLTAYTAKDLREDAKLRGEISKQASQVLAQITEAGRRAA